MLNIDFMLMIRQYAETLNWQKEDTSVDDTTKCRFAFSHSDNHVYIQT